MMGQGRLFCLTALLMVCAGPVLAAPMDGRHGGCDGQQGSSPCVDKVDPPNWWTDMPSPMLLLYGRNLSGVRISVRGKGVSVAKTQFSANGHYAFVWLGETGSNPQTLEICVKAAAGEVTLPYSIEPRKPARAGFQGFSAADAMYLIMTDRFSDGSPANNQAGANRQDAHGWHGGDFAGIEKHLDYLQRLGVTTVWTTPVVSNGSMPGSYHGYAATDLYAVDEHFGTLEQYRHLSDALHARGMKLVIDLAPNHVGVKHPWVLDPPAPQWLHGTLKNHLAAEHDFYQLLDPHAAASAWRGITDGWFTDAMPDLNQENPLVSQYLIQNALWWVETANLDGIRLDTFPYVDRAFWRDFHAELHSVFPSVTTVGEIFDGDPEVTSFFAGGVAHRGIDTGLDTPFDFPMYFALRDVLIAGKPMTKLAGVLRQDELYPHPERLVTFIGNHDTTRFITDAGGSAAKLKLALGLILTLRGLPVIYSGDEIGMPGGKDPDDRRDFPGGFDGDAHSAFTPEGRTPAQQDIFAWSSGLLALRAAHPALETGLEQDLLANNDVFAFVRAQDSAGCGPDHASERMLIVVNKGQHQESIDVPTEGTALAGCREFRAMDPAHGDVPVAGGGKLHIEEEAESITIFSVN